MFKMGFHKKLTTHWLKPASHGFTRTLVQLESVPLTKTFIRPYLLPTETLSGCYKQVVTPLSVPVYFPQCNSGVLQTAGTQLLYSYIPHRLTLVGYKQVPPAYSFSIDSLLRCCRQRATQLVCPYYPHILI